MTDFEMILHDMILTRGAESVVRQMLGSDSYRMNVISESGVSWDFDHISGGQINFEVSRASHKIYKRNKRR